MSLNENFESGMPSGMYALVFNTRRPALADRRVLALANPTAATGEVDLDTIIERQPGEHVRHYEDCTPVTVRRVEVGPYETFLLEVY